jgi:hypothetical protein
VSANVRGSHRIARADLATAVLTAITDEEVHGRVLSGAAG